MNRYEAYMEQEAKERASRTLAAMIGDKKVSSPEPSWKTRDGRVITIRAMTDNHLMSSLAMCERNGWFKNRVGFLKIEARRRGLLP